MSEERELDGRCGACARFVHVRVERDALGVERKVGDCLLGAWQSPLHENGTCSHYVRRGTVAKSMPKSSVRSSVQSKSRTPLPQRGRVDVGIAEELMAMDASEFRSVLREVLWEELGVGDSPIGGRWEGGEMVLTPGKEGTAEKRIPIEALFHKIVMIRDKLRVLEQKINSHPKLTDEDKVQMQQYVTQCYGSLTTFNVLFAERRDGFVGQKGDRDD